MLYHDGVLFEVLFEGVNGVWVELGDVSDTLEEEGVAVLGRTSDQLRQLPVLSQHVCVSLVCCQIDSQCYQLFTYDGLWAVDYQLVDEGDTVGVGESSFGFILQTQMIQQFDNLRPKPRSLESIH